LTNLDSGKWSMKNAVKGRKLLRELVSVENKINLH